MESFKYGSEELENFFRLTCQEAKNTALIQRTENGKVFRASFSRKHSRKAKNLADLFQQLFGYQPVICEKKKEGSIEIWSSKNEVINYLEPLVEEGR